ENVTCARPLVADRAFRMDLPDHRVPELRLDVVDGMPADDVHARLAELARTTPHDLVQQARSELVAWKGRDAEREHGLRPDHINIAQGVRRGDGSELERVVDDRR